MLGKFRSSSIIVCTAKEREREREPASDHHHQLPLACVVVEKKEMVVRDFKMEMKLKTVNCRLSLVNSVMMEVTVLRQFEEKRKGKRKQQRCKRTEKKTSAPVLSHFCWCFC